MCMEKYSYFIITWLQIGKKFTFAFIPFYLPFIACVDRDSLLHHITSSTVKRVITLNKPYYNFEYINDQHLPKQKSLESLKSIQSEDIFQIEPSDAIDITKYSQPAINHHISSFPRLKVPSTTLSTSSVSKTYIFSEKISHSDNVPKKNSSKPMRDLRYIESITDKNSHTMKTSLGSGNKFEDDNNYDFQSDMSFNDELTFNSNSQNNFTHADANLLPVPSDTILSFQTPANKENISKNESIKENTKGNINVSSHYSEKPLITFTTFPNYTSSVLPELSTEASVLYNTYHIETINQTDSDENSFSTLLISSIHDEANISYDEPLLNRGFAKLSSGTVAGIVIAVLVCVTLLSSAVIYLLYRKYNGKCTSVVEGKFNSDNCGYLDDSLRSSIYLNNHIELPKESSEEMSSLDNDSFLNSLETMTIQNYWADNSKNTKV